MPAEAVSFLALHPEGGHLYAVSDDTVGAVRVDDPSGELTELNRQLTEGASPCYVSVDASGRYAFVANYEAASVSMFPLREDGRLEEASDVVHHEGSSIDPDRQDVPHPHSIRPGPENRFVYVPDLGTDRVVIYRIDFETGTLRPAQTPFVELHDGSGPRHLEFHPDGRHAYVINELDSTLTAFEYSPDDGALDELETVTTLPEGYDDESYPAEVRVHPSGRWLYGSNRGHDSIAVFEIDEESGGLDIVDHESTRGHWPRHFAIDPEGRYLYAENRRSDSIVSFEIDEGTGELSFMGVKYDLPEPICMVFGDSE